MDSMEKAGKESEQFSGQLKKLTGNLSSLNSIYGSMLTAMRGGGESGGNAGGGSVGGSSGSVS